VSQRRSWDTAVRASLPPATNRVAPPERHLGDEQRDVPPVGRERLETVVRVKLRQMLVASCLDQLEHADAASRQLGLLRQAIAEQRRDARELTLSPTSATRRCGRERGDGEAGDRMCVLLARHV